MDDAIIMKIPINGTVHSRGNLLDNPLTEDDYPEQLRELLGKTFKGGKTELQMLEGKHVLTMIVYIYYMSPVIKTHIYTNVAKCSTINDKLDALKSLGIIRIHSTTRTNTSIIARTNKGKLVAFGLITIVRIIRKFGC